MLECVGGPLDGQKMPDLGPRLLYPMSKLEPLALVAAARRESLLPGINIAVYGHGTFRKVIFCGASNSFSMDQDCYVFTSYTMTLG